MRKSPTRNSYSADQACEGFAWHPLLGPDHSHFLMDEPIVRIAREGMSPGRTIGRPKKNARRNTIDFRDPIDGIIKRAEGTLEYKVFCQSYRDPTVAKVEPQFGPFPFVNAKGKKEHVTWDARVTYSDGHRMLQACRPARSVAKHDYAETVRMMFLQMPPEECDSAAVVTERDIPAWASANGRHIHSVLNQGHWTSLHEMDAAARAMPVPSMTIEAFCEPFGGIQRTYRTAVYLIAKRILWAKPGLITPATIVAPYRYQDVENA